VQAFAPPPSPPFLAPSSPSLQAPGEHADEEDDGKVVVEEEEESLSVSMFVYMFVAGVWVCGCIHICVYTYVHAMHRAKTYHM
jgi:hypothetical protein